MARKSEKGGVEPSCVASPTSDPPHVYRGLEDAIISISSVCIPPYLTSSGPLRWLTIGREGSCKRREECDTMQVNSTLHSLG